MVTKIQRGILGPELLFKIILPYKQAFMKKETCMVLGLKNHLIHSIINLGVTIKDEKMAYSWKRTLIKLIFMNTGKIFY